MTEAVLEMRLRRLRGWLLDEDPQRTQFLVASLLICVLFGLYAWQSVAHTRLGLQSELAYFDRLFVEGTRANLIVQESRLLLLGEQLRRAGAMVDPSAGRSILEQMAGMDPGMVEFALAKADGQIVVASGDRQQKRPNLLDSAEAGESFRQALESRRLLLGRPYFLESAATWIIPLHMALPEADGAVRWVMTAGLRIHGENTVWARIDLPPGVGMRLLREDGYLQYAVGPQVETVDPGSLRSMYETALPEAEREALARLRQKADPAALVHRQSGSRSLLAAVIDLPEYGMAAVSWVSQSVLIGRAVRVLLLPTGMVFVSLAAIWVVFARARTLQDRQEGQLIHLAHHDSLTGLPNRALVLDRLRQALAVSVRQDRGAALLFADLDNFKHVNDTYGHGFGDALIRHMANVFTQCVRPGDTVARLGGDEFLVVLPDLKDDADARQVAERILARFDEPVVIDGQAIQTSTSIGIAVGPRDASDPAELLRLADIALYDAKGRGRRCFSFFDARLNEAARRRSDVELNLREAVAGKQLSVVYQPIHRTGPRGDMAGVEALVRWESPLLGAVSPTEFIPVAEEAGLVGAIGEFVLERATADVAALGVECGRDLKVSVNISAWELAAGRLVESVEACLRQSGLAARNLMLELTESVMIEDVSEIEKQLVALRGMGANIAIDDFGVGYSSISYLNRLPVSTLKIERSFIRDLCDDSQDRALVRSIIAMAHALDMVVVAEGVETEEQLEVLDSFDCNLVQGYLFSPPVTLPRLREMLGLEAAVTPG